jgi:hypothetical protein
MKNSSLIPSVLSFVNQLLFSMPKCATIKKSHFHFKELVRMRDVRGKRSNQIKWDENEVEWEILPVAGSGVQRQKKRCERREQSIVKLYSDLMLKGGKMLFSHCDGCNIEIWVRESL